MNKEKVLFTLISNVIISVLMTAVMCLVGPAPGTPITLESYFTSYGWGVLVSFLILTVFPMEKITKGFSKMIGAETKLGASLGGILPTNTIVITGMVLFFTIFNTGVGTIMTDAGPITFMTRYIERYWITWAVGYITVAIVQPIAFTLAGKVMSCFAKKGE